MPCQELRLWLLGDRVAARGLAAFVLYAARQVVLIAILVYSIVVESFEWPAIMLVSMLLPPTSCRHVMLARRGECGPCGIKALVECGR